ncbi:MAG: hypothetical protein GVY36_03365 [Verrucomicrobia bacterium]|jgi:hypothetical protein|nr:hypothetical protein [Verrucomicrobiota bacterium]
MVKYLTACIAIRGRWLLLGLLFLPLAPAQSAPADGFYHRGIEMKEGWRWWRSLGPMYAEAFPWVYHPRHGWLYLASPDRPVNRPAVHAWSPDLGWLWLDLDAYPWIQSAERGWLFETGPGRGGESRFYSRQLDNPLQRRGPYLIPDFATRIQALPLSRFSRSGEPLPESLLNAPPTAADWSALEALLAGLDGLDVDASREAMRDDLGRVHERLNAVLELSSLVWEARFFGSERYPRTEAGWRVLLADLAEATDTGTRGLHRALNRLEAFDARWGAWIERVYTVADGLDAMDGRLIRQRERLREGEVATLQTLNNRVTGQVNRVLHGFAESPISDFGSWRIDEATGGAFSTAAARNSRAERFLRENRERMEVFETAYAAVAGGDDFAGVADQYARLRERMDAATEVVNELSALYWEVLSALQQGGPYRLDGPGRDSGSVTTVIGGGNRHFGGPEYRERLSRIREAFTALDDRLGLISALPRPLLRLENIPRLGEDAALLNDVDGQIGAINTLLELPVPEHFQGSPFGIIGPEDLESGGAPSDWTRQAAPTLDQVTVSPALQRLIDSFASLRTNDFIDPNSDHNSQVIGELRSIRRER